MKVRGTTSQSGLFTPENRLRSHSKQTETSEL